MENSLKEIEFDSIEQELYYENIGNTDGFEEAYLGKFRNRAELATHVIEELGILQNMPENLKGYFDYAFFGKDLLLSDFWGVEIEGNIYVYYNL